MTTAALIPAAGNGLRLGEGPKALLALGDSTLLEIVVAKIRPLVDTVIVAAPGAYQAQFRTHLGPDVQVIAGGEQRRDSVEQMLAATDADTVLIQNVASPFASATLLQQVLEAAIRHGAAGAFYSPSVPIARIQKQRVVTHWDRSEAGYFQTPQAFSRDILQAAHEHAGSRHYQSTAQYAMEAGFEVVAIPGEEENIKITSDLDWQIARHVIAPRLGLCER